jgi:hypothetical protein
MAGSTSDGEEPVATGCDEAPTFDPAAAPAIEALARAVTFFRDEVATHEGYVWRVSEDLTRRFGEGDATIDQIWVQPPGTPAVASMRSSA